MILYCISHEAFFCDNRILKSDDKENRNSGSNYIYMYVSFRFWKISIEINFLATVQFSSSTYLEISTQDHFYLKH